MFEQKRQLKIIIIIENNLMLTIVIFSSSGSQPGTRVHQVVHDKSRGVREIRVLCNIDQYLVKTTS